MAFASTFQLKMLSVLKIKPSYNVEEIQGYKALAEDNWAVLVSNIKAWRECGISKFNVMVFGKINIHSNL